MSSRKRKRNPSDFTPVNQRKIARLVPEAADSFKKIKELTLPDSASVEQKLGWAFSQCSAMDVMLVIQVISDGGHQGIKFVQNALRSIKMIDDMDIIFQIADVLLPSQKALTPLAHRDHPSVLVTPLTSCFECGNDLLPYEAKFTQVSLYQPMKKTQVKLARIRCKNCNLSYGPWSTDRGKRASAMNVSEAKRYYHSWNDARFIEGNERNYFSKEFCEQFSTLLCHCWTSVQGFSEAFSDAMHMMKLCDDADNIIEKIHLERRTLSEVFLEYEIWLELLEDSHGSKLERMLNVDEYLSTAFDNETYTYDHCHTTQCGIYGCEWYSIADGNWKLKYSLCMFQKLRESNIPGVNIPTNCTHQPLPGKAFCLEHLKITEDKLQCPTGVRDFIEMCQKPELKKKILEDMQAHEQQTVDQDINPSNCSTDGLATDSYTDDESDDDDETEKDKSEEQSCMRGPITRSMNKQAVMVNVQKTLIANGELVKGDDSNFGQLMRSVNLVSRINGTKCNKNLGSKRTINHYSRGHLFIVAPCGQIHRTAALYSSESPSQAFTVMVEHLQVALQNIDVKDWHKYTMVYDNICHVNDMLAARKELPTTTKDGKTRFPEPYNKAWIKINKAIDHLHISNHTDRRCQTEYHPDKIQSMHPNIKVNTMKAEQTFVWLSRFKKILCAMPKLHHQFMLHRIIYRRNEYTRWKLNSNSEPILPKCRNANTT